MMNTFRFFAKSYQIHRTFCFFARINASQIQPFKFRCREYLSLLSLGVVFLLPSICKKQSIPGDSSRDLNLSPIVRGHLTHQQPLSSRHVNFWVRVTWTHHPKKVSSRIARRLPGFSNSYSYSTFGGIISPSFGGSTLEKSSPNLVIIPGSLTIKILKFLPAVSYQQSSASNEKKSAGSYLDLPDIVKKLCLLGEFFFGEFFGTQFFTHKDRKIQVFTANFHPTKNLES